MTKEVSGRELHAWGLRRRWADLWTRYRAGKVDPGDASEEPVVEDEPALPARGRCDEGE
jgi:hypothetical protein